MSVNPLKQAVVERRKLTAQEIADQGNEAIAREGRTDIEWAVRDGKPYIRFKGDAPKAKKSLMDRRGEPMSEWETDELNRQLESYGATARYRSDGSRYMVV